MPNKINGYNATQPLAPVKGPSPAGAAAEKASADAATTSAQSADHLTLTDSARSLQKIEEAIAKAPVVDTAKVTSIKHAVSSGSYKIDAGRIADKILKFESGLK